MANSITHRRMVGGDGNEHIGRVKGVSNIGDFEYSVDEIVEMIESRRFVFFVPNGEKPAEVGIRFLPSGRKYIQTHADGYWNDGLLALPTF